MVLSLALPSLTNRATGTARTRSSTNTTTTTTIGADNDKSASTSSLSLPTTSSSSPSLPPSPQPTTRQLRKQSSSSTLTEALRSNPFGTTTTTTTTTAARSSKQATAAQTHPPPAPNAEAEEKQRERDELNAALATLAELFPDVKVEVFRELLVRFDGTSRLQVCVEQLLRYRTEWVKGRWNTPETTTAASTASHEACGDGGGGGGSNENGLAVHIPKEERFRSDEYKKAVKRAMALEFRALSRSTINAVLAEVNFSYTRARPTLRELSRKTWRVTLGNIFPSFKKKKDKDDHPLLVWQKLPTGESLPRLKDTGCAELDRELHDMLLAPLLTRWREQQEETDRRMAEELNESEAQDVGAVYECDCCLSDVTFEQIATCSDGPHIICFNCIQRTLHEALFGQGWGKSIDNERSTLRCLAPLREGTCPGSLDTKVTQRAILCEKAGVETYQKFEERLAQESLLKSQLKLVRCPFCSYAEVDPVYDSPEQGFAWRFRRANLLTTILTTIFLLDLIPLLLIPISIFLLFCPSILATVISASLRNVCLKTRNQRFTCSNLSCRRQSCITCHKPWRDPHVCHEPLLLSLRTTVEAARTAAIKRTCPQCGLSFVKASGCNKLTCVCGYSMCYLCRKALGPPLRATNNNNILGQRRAAPRPRARPRNNGQRNQENAPLIGAGFDGAFAEDAAASDDSDNNNDNHLDPAIVEEDFEEEPEGYKHFCEHFRVNPGSRCSECNKCELYRAEDEEAIARRAGEKAEREWRIREGLLGSSSSSSSSSPSSSAATAGGSNGGAAAGAGGVQQGFGDLRVPLQDPASPKKTAWGPGAEDVLRDWSWQGNHRADWRFWTQDLWKDGRWKAEVQILVDGLVERIIIVDV
ncbi:hypothetical protein AJ80_05668 [Polytolypa hystricis UAMH7299]|uniref:RING-type domain-containing protein n=1 Tax=Polytolypa hystricis (strain UAMH7299) TaxID=1447883 RepID=A0A2B7Y1W7_POLH7|nr:hypothetical protein AJ80_05668 [Polytolypa hystricis UAMH7299]